MNDINALAKTALDQANEIQALAEKNDWEQLEILQKKQNDIVNQLAIADIPLAQQPKIREILLQVRDKNNASIQLADAQKAKLVAEKKKLNKGAKMQQAMDAFK